MKRWIMIGMLAMALSLATSVAYASHSWGGYHWARTSNPFTLKLGDNLSSTWDPILATTSSDWSQSPVLDTTIVSGQAQKSCAKVTSGRVEVCNKAYGLNGWLGVAGIWVSGSHITQGYVKVNDSYFTTATYNTTAWRNLVMCQEVGHTLGLAHQDENFYNQPLGSCMDYTSDPTPNQHPNQHDYDQLVTIYSHTDSYNSFTAAAAATGAKASASGQDDEDFGAPAGKKDQNGRDILFVKHLGGGQKLYTWVLWTEPGRP